MEPVSCFITSTADFPLQPIVELLRGRGVEVLSLSEHIGYGSDIISALEETIEKADLVLAVLGTPNRSENVLFEIGYSLALKKKVIVIAREGIQIPTNLGNLHVIRSSPDNVEALNYFLDHALEADEEETQRLSIVERHERTLGTKADYFIEMIDSLGEKPLEMNILPVLSELFSELGLRFAAQTSFGKSQPDFAVWSTDALAYMPGPIVVEVKRELRGQLQTLDVVRQLHAYMEATGTSHAILIFMSANDKAFFELQKYPDIYAFDLRSLVNPLRDRSLGGLLIEQRNKRFHGV